VPKTWLWNDGVDLKKEDSPDAFKTVSNIPMPDGRTPEKKNEWCGRRLELGQKPQGKWRTGDLSIYEGWLTSSRNPRWNSWIPHTNDIDNVFTWIRNHDMDVPDDTQEHFKKLASVPMPDGRTPEHRAKDVEGILNWVRDRKDKEGTETDPSKKVAQLIPQKPGQSQGHL
jgi:hypothetical protein